MAVDAVELGIGVVALEVSSDLARGQRGGAREPCDGGPDTRVVVALPAAVRGDSMHLGRGRDRVVVPRVQDLDEPAVPLALEPARHRLPRAPALAALAAPLPRPLRHEVRAAPVAREVPPDHLARRVVPARRELLLDGALLRDAVAGREDVLLQREGGVLGRRVRAPRQRRRRVL